MSLRIVLPAVLFALSGCLMPTIQTDSAELVGAIEGTNAFAALRLLPDNRVEAYLCDGQGEEPTIQGWLSGTREGNEVSLSANNPYQDFTLRGTLVNEDFDGVVTIDGDEHAVSLVGVARPDGLYDVIFEDGVRRGWISRDGEERGPVQTLFRSNPVAFNDGSMVNITNAGGMKLKSRFTAPMLDGYGSSSLAPGRFLVEIISPHSFDNFVQAPTDEFMDYTDDSCIAFTAASLRSASNNQTLELVLVPGLSSPGRAVFMAAPSLFSSSVSLVDTFTLELTDIDSNLTEDPWLSVPFSMRVLAVRM